MKNSTPKTGGVSHRVQRIEREIREVVGSYLLTGFRGELPGIVSITRVLVSTDMRNAKIFFTVMGEEAEKKIAHSELKAHAHEVQHEINRRLQMKFCPKVTFTYDEGFENVMKVERILRDLSLERAAKAPREVKGADGVNTSSEPRPNREIEDNFGKAQNLDSSHLSTQNSNCAPSVKETK